MFRGHTLHDDDTQESVILDNSLLEQIDERLGGAYETREALINSAIQHYLAHIDEAADRDSVHKMSLQPSFKRQPSYT